MGKKKRRAHNYVNVPSENDVANINSDELLADSVKRDLITLHRVNKTVKENVSSALEFVRKTISEEPVDFTSLQPINRIEVNCYDGESEDIKNHIQKDFMSDDRYNDEYFSDMNLTKATSITLTTTMDDDSFVVFKYCVLHGKADAIETESAISSYFIV